MHTHPNVSGRFIPTHASVTGTSDLARAYILKVVHRTLRLAIVAFLLAGCSAGPASPSQSVSLLPTLDDPCSLLSRTEVARATGSEVTKVERGMSRLTGETSGCLYRTNGPYGAIVVDLDRGGEAEFRNRLQEESQRTYPNVELVSRLGDQAYLDDRTSLAVLSGRAVLWVGTQFVQPDAPAVLRALAELALARL